MITLKRRDVLIVDDDAAIRKLLSIALIRAGLTCETAGDGQEALEVLAGARFRVVLTDLMMPRLDGAQFVRELAAIEKVSAERPVVLIMTAFPEGERLPEIGEIVQAVIRKPFDIGEIASLVCSVIEVRSKMEGDSAGSTPSS